MASGRPKLPTPAKPRIIMSGGKMDLEATIRAQHATIQALTENVLRKGLSHGLAELDADGNLAGYAKTADLSAYALSTEIGTPQPLLHVREEQTSGTNGGTFTAGAWQTRVFNTVVTNEISGASLDSNQITLPAGTYRCLATLPAYAVDRHKAILYDTTGAANLVIGQSANAPPGGSVANNSMVWGDFTLTTESVLEGRHRCQTSQATFGFGVASSFGVVEVYSEAFIWKKA